MLLKHCVCICFRRACRIYNCHKAFILSRLAMKIDFSWQNTEFRRCYFINKTYETFLISKMLNELALISLRWLYARWSTPSVLICCSYCNVQNTHICVKGNKKKPTWQDSQKKNPLDMIRNGSRLNSRSGSIDISMESYIYIHGLISWRKMIHIKRSAL